MPLTARDITEIYDAESEGLLRYLARRTFDGQVALDLLGETFAVAYEKRRKFRGDADAEGAAWVYGIAKKQLAHYFRSGSIERRAMQRLNMPGVIADEDEIARVDRLAETSELRAAVALAIDDLTPEYRDALRLRVVDELSYSEVAERMNVSEQVARARVSRALKKLRETLAPKMELIEHV